MNVKKHKPIAVAFIYSRSGQYTVVAQDNPNDSILSISTDNKMGGGNQFSITLVPRQIIASKQKNNQARWAPWIKDWDTKTEWNWLQLIQPNDLVFIKMYRPGYDPIIRPRELMAANKQTRNQGDLISRFLNPRDPFGLVMIGVVDGARHSLDMRSGKPSEAITIYGRNIGTKMALNCPIYYFPYFNPSEEALKGFLWLADGLAVKGRPADVIATAFLIKFLPSLNIEFKQINEDPKVTTSKYFDIHQLLKFRLGGDKDFKIPFQIDLINYQGSFWNFFDMVSNKPWCEMWWDTRSDHDSVVRHEDVIQATAVIKSANISQEMVTYSEEKKTADPTNPNVKYPSYDIKSDRPANQADLNESGLCSTLYLRDTPFISPIDMDTNKTQDRWESLPITQIWPEDVAGFDLGIDDNETLNWFWTYSTWFPVPITVQRAAGPAVISFPKLMKTYGLRVFEVGSRIFASPDDNYDPDKDSYRPLMTRLNKLMAGWYYRNHEFLNGTLTVKGYQEYRIGDRVKFYYAGDWYVGYIEGVRHNFVNFGSWTTTLSITRGDHEKIDHKARYHAEQASVFTLESSLGK